MPRFILLSSVLIVLAPLALGFSLLSPAARVTLQQRTTTNAAVVTTSSPWPTPSIRQQRQQQQLYMSSEASVDEEKKSSTRKTIRQRLREITGFSLTVFRNTLRAATGFSFTALRASLRAATGISLTAIRISVVASTSAVVRNTMKFMLSPFPDWSRFFAQPFLVAYYGPLIAVRMHPTEGALKERLAKHRVFRAEMKDAVQAAVNAQNGGYWPVEVNEEGDIVAVAPEDGDESSVDISAAIAESFELVRSLETRDQAI